jgi:hypothetical protein
LGLNNVEDKKSSEEVIQQDGIKKIITTEKIGNSVIKQENIEYNLGPMMNNNINLNSSHFYRGRIKNMSSIKSIDDLTNECSSSQCEVCLKSTPFNCKYCKRGFFLYNNQCYTVCPENYISDIFKRRCCSLNYLSNYLNLIDRRKTAYDLS